MSEEIKYIVTVELVKQLGNLSNVDDDKINIHFPQAKKDTIGIIGKTKYDSYADPENDTEEIDEDKLIIARGEAYFVLSYCVRSLNIVSSGAGIIKTTGFNEGKSENLSQYEIERMESHYRAEAERMLNPYKVITDSNSDGNDEICNAGNTKFIAI